MASYTATADETRQVTYALRAYGGPYGRHLANELEQPAQPPAEQQPAQPPAEQQPAQPPPVQPPPGE